MKSVIGFLIVGLISIPSFAGSHTEGTLVSAASAPSIVSVKYGKVVVSEREEGNCDMVSTNGSLDDCHSIATYATKVRVTVEYLSEAGANPTPEASEEDSKEGPVTMSFDFDPAQFDAATLAQINSNPKAARDLFNLSAETVRYPTSVVDYDRSSYCSPEADSSCENQVVYKASEAVRTLLNVTKK